MMQLPYQLGRAESPAKPNSKKGLHSITGTQWEFVLKPNTKPERKKGLASNANIMGFCWFVVQESVPRYSQAKGIRYSTNRASFADHEHDERQGTGWML